jgi:hypothetical protein
MCVQDTANIILFCKDYMQHRFGGRLRLIRLNRIAISSDMNKVVPAESPFILTAGGHYQLNWIVVQHRTVITTCAH